MNPPNKKALPMPTCGKSVDWLYQMTNEWFETLLVYRNSALSQRPLTHYPLTHPTHAVVTWLKLMATAVARDRSLVPNHVALSSGGVH